MIMLYYLSTVLLAVTASYVEAISVAPVSRHFSAIQLVEHSKARNTIVAWSNMFPWMIERFLHYCDWLGLCTEYYNRTRLSTKYQKYRSTIFFMVHIIVAVCISTIMCHFMFHPLREFDPASLANDSTKYSAMCIVYILVIVEAMCRRRQKREFWQLYDHLHTAYPSANTYRQALDRFSYRLIWFFALYLLQELTSIPPVFRSRPRSMEYLLFWMCDFQLFLIHQLRIFYYVFYVNLLSEELSAINESFAKIVRTCNDGQFEERELNAALTAVRRRYGLVRRMAEYLNEIFSWSQLIGILNCFVGVACGFNFISTYWHDIQAYDRFSKFNCSKLILVHEFMAYSSNCFCINCRSVGMVPGKISISRPSI